MTRIGSIDADRLVSRRVDDGAFFG